MSIIKNIEQVKPIIKTAQIVSKIDTFAQSGGDGWERFERILTGINELFTHATASQKPNLEPDVHGRGILSNSSIEKERGGVVVAPVIHEKPFQTEEKIDPEKDKKLNAIKKQMIDYFSTFVEECRKENPNMTVGEAINKMDINVTQLSVLFQIAKGG